MYYSYIRVNMLRNAFWEIVSLCWIRKCLFGISCTGDIKMLRNAWDIVHLCWIRKILCDVTVFCPLQIDTAFVFKLGRNWRKDLNNSCYLQWAKPWPIFIVNSLTGLGGVFSTISLLFPPILLLPYTITGTLLTISFVASLLC